MLDVWNLKFKVGSNEGLGQEKTVKYVFWEGVLCFRTEKKRREGIEKGGRCCESEWKTKECGGVVVGGGKERGVVEKQKVAVN